MSSSESRFSRVWTTASSSKSPRRCANGASPRATRSRRKAQAEVTVEGQPRGTIKPGDYFGEIALLTGSDRTATITARGDMVCWGMTPWDFRPLVESNSTIAWKLLTAMADKLK
jgi:CRP-like cAMP-binding protein